MAKILSIEVEASQVRVAEIEVRGKKGRIFNCFCIPAPQGAVEDGQIRDTKSLAEVLREELSQRKIKTKKVYFATGSTRIASREVRIPFVKTNRIQSIIEANATDYFPIDDNEIYLILQRNRCRDSEIRRWKRRNQTVSSDGLCGAESDFCSL